MMAYSLDALRGFWRGEATVALAQTDWERIDASARVVQDALARGEPVYGVNTGFGLLAQTHIGDDQLVALQRNLLLSHACGVGEDLSDDIARLVLTLKVISLTRGHSGVRRVVVERLLALLAAGAHPCIPSQGSVGASGDLAPLAHLAAAAFLGVGRIRLKGEAMDAADALAQIDAAPFELGPKEGLALINGTQVSTAIALDALFRAEAAFAAALVAGAMSVDAMKGSDAPFDPRIQTARGQKGQIEVADVLRILMKGSDIRHSHVACDRVQDPYSLRCQPQVMGACLDVLRSAAQTLQIEASAATDNPLVFTDDGAILSGGNFHAEPAAFAADMIAMAMTEVASLSERRLALLVDPKMSGLPAFLVGESGVNSGFMIAQVTAAALVSEMKTLAHPASVDSIPTSANQEDHVSMATFAARKAREAARCAAKVIAIEQLAAAQGIDFHAPLKTSQKLATAHAWVRARAHFYGRDRYFAPDIEAVTTLVESGAACGLLAPWRVFPA
ncbi:MAG: histidine ammonia-lyase [Alphaproteobacteria bacterium]|nr:histidine ammonia-lyase [Alphaproteobacteria bacterium]